MRDPRVDAWLFRVVELQQVHAVLPALSGDERRFAAGIASRRRRASFLAGRSLLRMLLARRLGCLPAAVPIIRRVDGKPRLAFGQLEFSLSHSGEWIAVALSGDCAVGIDVEPIRAMARMGEIVAQFFPPAARAEFDAASPGTEADLFFRWWTRIEAAVKVSGQGLDVAPSCFHGVSCESCDLIPGLASAVAARTEGPLTVQWHVAPPEPVCGTPPPARDSRTPCAAAAQCQGSSEPPDESMPAGLTAAATRAARTRG